MSKRQRGRALPVLLSALFAAAMFALGQFSHRTFARLMQEDAWGEWATFLAFALAGAFAAHGALKPRGGGKLDRLALGGLAAFAVFCAGEELSWGQRLLSFRPPELFLSHNFQQEANLHNFLKNILDTRFILAGVALIYGVIAPFVPQLYTAFRPARRLVPLFAIVALIELVYPFELAGELGELLLGLTLLLDVLARRSENVALEVGLPALVLVAAAAMTPVVDALTLDRALALLPGEQQKITALAEQLARAEVPQKKLFKKRRVHKRLYTSVQKKYVRVEDREDPFFLDAWNQPHWIAFRRAGGASGKLLIYSFGPNRRRDTELDLLKNAERSEDVLGGDDVGVLIEVRLAALSDELY